MTATRRTPTAAADFDGPGHRARLAGLHRDLAAVGTTPLRTTRGDLVPHVPAPRAVPLAPRLAFHGSQNGADTPMARRDGPDIPLVAQADRGSSEFGPDEVRDRRTPDRSNSQRLWGRSAGCDLDLLTFSDAPVFEKSSLLRTEASA
ncbi:hypothetical protein [Blastococcus sp. SYSU D00813]